MTNIMILFSQSWQDCFWNLKFLQHNDVVGNSQFYVSKFMKIFVPQIKDLERILYDITIEDDG